MPNSLLVLEDEQLAAPATYFAVPKDEKAASNGAGPVATTEPQVVS